MATAMYKKQQQEVTLLRIEGTGVGLSYRTLKNNVNAGIQKQTGGDANGAVTKLKNGQNPAIGSLFAIIVGCIVAIVGLISSIVSKRKAALDKETASILSQSNLNGIAPDTLDF
ncbi:hypothetical protein LJC11_04455, partial [Bacteroidales bacterium OttesenSCG-928-I21]|nr:hypothetical protein [Bacteroidales bacterium OttesenSCG-928-I21]